MYVACAEENQLGFQFREKKIDWSTGPVITRSCRIENTLTGPAIKLKKKKPTETKTKLYKLK